MPVTITTKNKPTSKEEKMDIGDIRHNKWSDADEELSVEEELKLLSKDGDYSYPDSMTKSEEEKLLYENSAIVMNESAWARIIKSLLTVDDIYTK
ncbi:hypothetical protein JTE90_019651 [Oedothorax gibbosus]|uniref:Uncharacterized protein n=1 Tax=Oedothorax gibbosus TaxID=931172 RepID=A0AAV6U222_9ARAC|nr:hypothetical protein JTE90_019651 [Oedothorax gibbosus]